jgi:hypothetical protein
MSNGAQSNPPKSLSDVLAEGVELIQKQQQEFSARWQQAASQVAKNQMPELVTGLDADLAVAFNILGDEKDKLGQLFLLQVQTNRHLNMIQLLVQAACARLAGVEAKETEEALAKAQS